jgi:alkylhydroperoxidase/carboxymuconolactone decarboxylase family protein YurZ
MLKEAGFGGVELVKETGFNSTPNTKGVLIRARKEVAVKKMETRRSVDESLRKYQTFFDEVYAQGVLDRKTKHLIALGASLAAGCQP